jgi:superfamily I DNA/RNA helicase
VGEKIRLKRLSKTDRVLILWLIHLAAERVRRGGAQPEESLPDYSHVMVDEAQQYDPLVLRLFCQLSRPPFNSVTLVGDLRQRLREDGGVVMWDDLGLAIPEDRRARLLVNYRWSKAAFRALHRLATVLELPDIELKEPLRWPSGKGLPAEYKILPNPDEELESVVDRVNALRSRRGAERWSIAVLLPDEYATRHKMLIDRLDSVAMNASWTVGANVRAGKEGITLTNAQSVVGLEFDAVFIAGAQHLLPAEPSEVQRQRFWVMATRTRQFLYVSSAEPVQRLNQWLSGP